MEPQRPPARVRFRDSATVALVPLGISWSPKVQRVGNDEIQRNRSRRGEAWIGSKAESDHAARAGAQGRTGGTEVRRFEIQRCRSALCAGDDGIGRAE